MTSWYSYFLSSLPILLCTSFWLMLCRYSFAISFCLYFSSYCLFNSSWWKVWTSPSTYFLAKWMCDFSSCFIWELELIWFFRKEAVSSLRLRMISSLLLSSVICCWSILFWILSHTFGGFRIRYLPWLEELLYGKPYSVFLDISIIGYGLSLKVGSDSNPFNTFIDLFLFLILSNSDCVLSERSIVDY
jgi:hypothetical protein